MSSRLDAYVHTAAADFFEVVNDNSINNELDHWMLLIEDLSSPVKLLRRHLMALSHPRVAARAQHWRLRHGVVH